MTLCLKFDILNVYMFGRKEGVIMDNKFNNNSSGLFENVEKQKKGVSEKRCLLCNKAFDYNYDLFGRGCLENIYNLLNIPMPSWSFRNKEMFLCTKVAHKRNKFFIDKEKKYFITKRVIALAYLEEFNYNTTDKIISDINKDIDNVKIFSKEIKEIFPFKLNSVYLAKHMVDKFNEIMNEWKIINQKSGNAKDIKIMESFINRFKFVFDIEKKIDPIFYAISYEMQYEFWNIVFIGGLLPDYKLSARLLRHSLVPFGDKTSALVIDDNEVINKITSNKSFISKIEKAILKYGKSSDEFNTAKLDGFNSNIKFEDFDLFYSLHKAEISINAKKNQLKKWDLRVKIKDTYDFTDLKNINEYRNSTNSTIKSLFSSTINNYAIVSSQYGVIKPYDIIIAFTIKDYVIN